MKVVIYEVWDAPQGSGSRIGIRGPESAPAVGRGVETPLTNNLHGNRGHDTAHDGGNKSAVGLPGTTPANEASNRESPDLPMQSIAAVETREALAQLVERLATQMFVSGQMDAQRKHSTAAIFHKLTKDTYRSAVATKQQLLDALAEPAATVPARAEELHDYQRLKQQALAIERILRDAGTPSMSIEAGVQWLANVVIDMRASKRGAAEPTTAQEGR